jgi:hypothetical protein
MLEDKCVCSEMRDRYIRSYVILILHNYINNLNETDGHRPIGRPWHSSPLRNCSQAQMIFLSTSTRPMSPCMNNALEVLIRIGKIPFLSGLPFYIVLTRAKDFEK